MNRNTKGQGLAEYALILVLVAVVVVAVLATLGTAVSDIFSSILEAISPPEETPPPDCYGSLLLPYLIGLTGALSLLLKASPDQSYSEPCPQ